MGDSTPLLDQSLLLMAGAYVWLNDTVVDVLQ